MNYAPPLISKITISTDVQRTSYIDALKVICCFLIIVLHAVGIWTIKVGYTVEWFTATAFSAITRCAVPLFIMVSGALMLSRDTGDLLKFYRKGLMRYGLPLAFALLYYKLNSYLRYGDSELLQGLAYNVLSNPGYHLWYMWMWLGLLAATPIFTQICKNRAALHVYLALGLLFAVIGPNLGQFGISIPIYNTIAIDYGFYYVIGYWLSSKAPFLRLRTLCLMVAASLACIMVATYVSSLALGKLNEFYWALPSLPVLTYSAAVFLLFKQTIRRQHSVITVLSRSSFSIYLLHILVLGFLLPLFAPSFSLNSLLCTIFIVSPCTFGVAWAISITARRIPALRFMIP